MIHPRWCELVPSWVVGTSVNVEMMASANWTRQMLMLTLQPGQSVQ